jgi:hypothetical protein
VWIWDPKSRAELAVLKAGMDSVFSVGEVSEWAGIQMLP